MITFPIAKINLGLNIVEHRSDGYHNLETECTEGSVLRKRSVPAGRALVCTFSRSKLDGQSEQALTFDGTKVQHFSPASKFGYSWRVKIC